MWDADRLKAKIVEHQKGLSTPKHWGSRMIVTVALASHHQQTRIDQRGIEIMLPRGHDETINVLAELRVSLHLRSAAGSNLGQETEQNGTKDAKR